MSSNDFYSVVARSVSKNYLIRDGLDKRKGIPVAEQENRSGLFKKNLVVHAVKSASFALKQGESVGILGHNGSGKSTLLRLISGGEAPSSGEIFTTHRPTLLGVSAALQPHLSGTQNIKLGCYAMGMSKDEMEACFSSIVEFAELGDDIHRPMETYSSGMGARLTFAISTAKEPEILLVDEALSTGDASFSVKSKRRMGELLSNAGTVVIVSHNATQVSEMCTRAIWLHEGEIIADGDVDLIAKDYAKWAMRTGRGNLEAAGNLIEGYKSEYVKPIIRFQDE